MDDIVKLNEFNIANVSSIDFPHSGIKYKTLAEINEKLEIIMTMVTDMECEFDIIGIDCSIANALRRILLSEVPTMTIEKCYIHCNTSLVSDPVLSHRMGLVPFKIDPRQFEFKTENSPPTDLNTIVLNLNVTCQVKPEASQDAILPSEKYDFDTVYSGDVQWFPQGDQQDKFKDNPIEPIYKDIILAKLRPGQSIHAEFHCQKGIGKEHAKWSGCVASYRLMPSIELKSDIVGEEALLLQKCFPKGVIGIKDGKAIVENPRKDTGSREVYRHESIKDKVQLGRKKDHFLCILY
jgi:DNA-directed RNA polymerase I and III subunit RPAC1